MIFNLLFEGQKIQV